MRESEPSIETKVVEVAIAQVKGFFYPSAAEKAAAYELLIELTTRPSSAQLAATDATIGEELLSIEEMFDLTREILRKHGTDSSKGSAGNLSLAVVALRVLNEVFRPVLNRWRPLLDDHMMRRPADEPSISAAEWERRWERAHQCRTDLNSMRASTRAYIETLSHIAGTPAIADAILSAPSAAAFPHTRIESTLHPDAAETGVSPRRKMVRWLNPGELFLTWLSGFPAKRSLKRAAKRTPVVEVDDGGRLLPDASFPAVAGEEFWFDYVADMGDGFDGTAPVAWLMGRESVTLPDHRSNEIPTPPAAMPRGVLLVFGGDEVYPYAKAGAYEAQTELPFRMGLQAGGEGGDSVAPKLVAVPGNHDWLGGIEEFERTFVSGRDFADHWKTVQSNLWWHVELPQGWWLWGIDTGLHNELIGPQEEYFRQAAETLRPGDRVILCTPVPLWQLRLKYPEAYAQLRSTFDPLISSAGATMPLCLSGDTHFFAHLERVDIDGVEDHVTAGGGGAFLQPTHNIPERVPLERGNAEFKLTSRWPLPADSRAIAPGAKRMFNPQYWPLIILCALLSTAYAALVQVRLGADLFVSSGTGPDVPESDFVAPSKFAANSADALNWHESLRWALLSPLATAFLILIACSGIVMFRGNSVEPKLSAAARAYGLVAGGSLSATFLIVTTTRLDLTLFSKWHTISVSILVAVVSGILSVWLFLKIVRWANRRIKANDTLAFGQAYSTRFKHFLRFRIDQDGNLTCYVVGIDPVGAGWYKAMTPMPGVPGSVPPYDPAGNPRIHYVWGKTYEKFAPTPIRIALSVSDPEDRSAAPLNDAFEHLASSMLQGGHSISFGGRPGEGFTERLSVIDRARHADNPNAEPHMFNYVADYLWDEEAAASRSSQMQSIRVERSGSSSGSALTDLAADVAIDGDRVMADLTAMRHLMNDHADVRVAIGGALRPGSVGTRIAPGVVEEAFLAVESGTPLLIAGGFGGAGELMAAAILGRLDPRTVGDLERHFAPAVPGRAGFAEMLARFTSTGVLRNGLTNGENLELLRSRHAPTVTSLILRSIHRVGSRQTR